MVSRRRWADRLVRDRLQYYLIASKPDVGLAEAAIRMLSFFTILTNIPVALAMTLPRARAGVEIRGVLLASLGAMASASYIIVVSAVYYAILRKLWNPGGLQCLAIRSSIVSHPPSISSTGSSSCQRGRSRQGRSHGGCLSRVGYAAFSLIHGVVTGFYPYPFLEVTQLGCERVLLGGGCSRRPLPCA
jgi:hypothetical protein